MKVRLTRSIPHTGLNSYYYIKAEYINNVYDITGNILKYIFNITEEKLEVLGDHKTIDILMNEKIY